jgi:uncharacterized protein YbjT (DUF2867 family)
MEVLVTGGTGFVGREVLRELHAAGHQIHLLVRRPDSETAKAMAAQYGAKLHAGDVLDPASLEQSLPGADAVIHLVGIISETRDRTFERVHTQGTQNVIGVARRVSARRFIHMSALGTRADAVSRYHRSKWTAEVLLRGSGLDWTIFRPSIIYGPGDGFVNRFAKITRYSPVIPLIGGGRTKFQPILVESVARAFTRALTEPKVIRQTFDLCGGETMTLERIVSQILAVNRQWCLKLPVPFPVARVQAACLEFIYGKVLGKPPPLSRDQVLMLQEDNVGNGRPAGQMFSLMPVRFVDGISRYLKKPKA